MTGHYIALTILSLLLPSAWPWSAALRYQLSAAASSCGTQTGRAIRTPKQVPFSSGLVWREACGAAQCHYTAATTGAFTIAYGDPKCIPQPLAAIVLAFLSLTLGELPKDREARHDARLRLDEDRHREARTTLAPAAQVAGSGYDGVVVTQIDPNGLAAEHGIKTGDVILDVGGKKVAAPGDVRNAIGEAQKNGKRTMLMRVKSDDVTKFVAIPIVRA